MILEDKYFLIYHDNGKIVIEEYNTNNIQNRVSEIGNYPEFLKSIGNNEIPLNKFLIIKGHILFPLEQF